MIASKMDEKKPVMWSQQLLRGEDPSVLAVVVDDALRPPLAILCYLSGCCIKKEVIIINQSGALNLTVFFVETIQIVRDQCFHSIV